MNSGRRKIHIKLLKHNVIRIQATNTINEEIITLRKDPGRKNWSRETLRGQQIQLQIATKIT